MICRQFRVILLPFCLVRAILPPDLELCSINDAKTRRIDSREHRKMASYSVGNLVTPTIEACLKSEHCCFLPKLIPPRSH